MQGSRPDLQVPMREISQSDTPTGFGGEPNPPVYVLGTAAATWHRQIGSMPDLTVTAAARVRATVSR